MTPAVRRAALFTMICIVSQIGMAVKLGDIRCIGQAEYYCSLHNQQRLEQNMSNYEIQKPYPKLSHWGY